MAGTEQLLIAGSAVAVTLTGPAATLSSVSTIGCRCGTVRRGSVLVSPVK